MNKRYELKMFNEDVKEEFLSGYSESTAYSYRRVFYKSRVLEEEFEEDLYNFNFDQIKNILYDFRPISLAASKSNAAVISIYISWAIQKGLRSNNINPMDGIPTGEYKKYVASKLKKMLKTEEEIFNIEMNLQNPQDAVCMLLPYLGVQGKACAEMLNLKKEDVDFNNHSLLLTDEDGSKRNLKIKHGKADFIFEIIKEAIDVKEYFKKNGQMDMSSPNLIDYCKLIENDYVIRACNIRTIEKKSPALKNIIYHRIASMNEEFGLPTIKYIVRSGMLAMAKKLLERDGVLGDEQYREIQKQYNFKNFNELRNIITAEKIKEIYGDD